MGRARWVVPETEPLMFMFEDGRPLSARRPAGCFFVALVFISLTRVIPLPADTTGPPPEAFQGLKGTEINGRTYRLGQSRDCRAVALVFLATECPISNAMVPELNSLHQVFHLRGVEIYGVHADPNLTRERAAKHRTDFKLRFPVLFDASGELRRRLKATHTPQAFVLSPEGEVIYQGLIDDRFADLGQKRPASAGKQEYVKEALNRTLAGELPEISSTTPIGCLLEAAPDKARTGSVTYNRDIAPIIQGNCSGCHRPGQSAPFSLLTYGDVSGHAEQICKVTESKRMPPWKADREYGHFFDERGLTEQEIALIERWCNTGKPEGDPVDRPKMPYFPDGWQLGQPDLILKMDEAYQLPAGGDDIHQCFVLPILMRENRLVSAIEFLPGNPKVVHHAAFYLDTTRTGRKLDAADADYGYRGFGNPGFLPASTLRNWLPGFTPRHLPKGTGRWIPKGSDMILEIHYRPSGKVETDQSTIGIHFAPRSSRQLVGELMVLNLDLEIPAGVRRHHHRAAFTLPENVTLFDAAPHMHLLGKEVKAFAELPDGSTKPLVWIREWDFDWQEQYEFSEPVRLPKGTRIVVDCYYDNSTENPLNPNSPPKLVTWGAKTNDSMGICHFQFTCDTLKELANVNQHYAKYLMGQSAPERYAGKPAESAKP